MCLQENVQLTESTGFDKNFKKMPGVYGNPDKRKRPADAGPVF
jgi:hypothetical protein